MSSNKIRKMALPLSNSLQLCFKVPGLMAIVLALCRCLQRILALRNGVANSLEASPDPVSIFTVQPLIGQQGVCVWRLMLCHKVPVCHLSCSVELLWGQTTPSQSVSENAKHNLGLSVLFCTDGYIKNTRGMQVPAFQLVLLNESLLLLKRSAFVVLSCR